MAAAGHARHGLLQISIRRAPVKRRRLGRAIKAVEETRTATDKGAAEAYHGPGWCLTAACYTFRTMGDQDGNLRVLQLFLKRGRRLPMQAVELVRAVAGQGLEGDASFGRPQRQVLLVSQRHLADLDLRPGDVRENITLSGSSLDSISPGDRLTMGDAVLEVIGDCDPCQRMDDLRPGLQDLIRGRRGILANVVVGGDIRVGDSVRSSQGVANRSFDAASGTTRGATEGNPT
jgi:MOSC domain